MGGYFSSHEDNSKLDQNVKDKIKRQVSKQVNKQLSELEEMKTKYVTLLARYEALQKDYDSLNNGEIPVKSRDVYSSSISIEALKKYVDDEILSTDANSKYIPDAIERRAYLTIYKTALESIQQLSNSTSLTLLNHQLTFHLEPLK